MGNMDRSDVVGIWQLTGYIHPVTKTVMPFHDGIAPTIEFLCYLDDGEYRGAKYLLPKSPSFDTVTRAFSELDEAVESSAGTWHLDDDVLTETSNDEGGKTTAVRVVFVGEKELVLEEPPKMGIALQVIYARRTDIATGDTGNVQCRAAEQPTVDGLKQAANELLNLGQAYLEAGFATFRPFGLSITQTGVVNEIRVPGTDVSYKVTRDQLIRLLSRRAQEGELAVAGICTANRLDSVGEFLAASVQNADGRNVAFVLRYTRHEDGAVILADDVTLQRGAYEFFAASTP